MGNAGDVFRRNTYLLMSGVKVRHEVELNDIL